MKRIICWLFGHRWEEINQVITGSTRNWVSCEIEEVKLGEITTIKCKRCGRVRGKNENM